MTQLLVVKVENSQAQAFMDYASKLPFVELEAPHKQSFAEAEKDGISVEQFFDELRTRVNNHFQNA